MVSLPPKKSNRSIISSSMRDRLLPDLGIGPVSRPCDLSHKLLRGRAYKRGGTLPLLTVDELVETLVYLRLSVMVGHLLANQML